MLVTLLCLLVFFLFPDAVLSYGFGTIMKKDCSEGEVKISGYLVQSV